MPGIVSYGAYVPARRLQRLAVFSAVGWYSPAIMMMAMGERSLCNWDEDALSMSVEAARHCLRGLDKQRVDGVYLAGTTLPFADRQNAGIVAAALNLASELATVDFTGSQKAGVSALIAGLQAVGAASGKACWSRRATGDRRGRAALRSCTSATEPGRCCWVRTPSPRRRLVCAGRRFCVDHYRGAGARYDYGWEERWVRDEGYGKIIPRRSRAAQEAELDGRRGRGLRVSMFFTGRAQGDRQAARPAAGAGDRQFPQQPGRDGCAHPLLQLIAALEKAKPGDKVVVAVSGRGATRRRLRSPSALRRRRRARLSAALAHRWSRKIIKKRCLHRAHRGRERHPRRGADANGADRVVAQAQDAAGPGRRQMPSVRHAAVPGAGHLHQSACNAFHRLEDYEFSERPAAIKAFTGDLLAVTIEPPAVYGMVQFVGGGRMVADFTDCEMHKLKVGQPMRMVFRKRYHDAERGFTGYFWKATPTGEAAKGGA
jgi:hypothetical protein